jgi:hypothetical protein
MIYEKYKSFEAFYNKGECDSYFGTWITLSVGRLATDWTIEGKEFDPSTVKNFVPHVAQTESGAQTASHSMIYGGTFAKG